MVKQDSVPIRCAFLQILQEICGILEKQIYYLLPPEGAGRVPSNYLNSLGRRLTL
jgi:hypothetical protein